VHVCELTPKNRDLLEKLTVCQLVEKFVARGGTRRSSEEPPIFPNPSQINSAYALQSCFFKIHYSGVVPSTV